MNRGILHNSVFLSFIFALALVVAINGCGSSSKSSQAITDTTGIVASFSISHVVDTTANPATDIVNAGATFFDGLLTVQFEGGSVEVIDPQGTVTNLNVLFDPFGAPYYSANLASPLASSQVYVFRVTLVNGTKIDNRVTTPAQDPVVTDPVASSFVSKSAAKTTVSWEGTNSGNALILIGPHKAIDILNIFNLGGTSVPDLGTTNLLPSNMTNVNVGTNVFAIVRSTVVPANGFAPSSSIGAFRVYAEPVIITE